MIVKMKVENRLAHGVLVRSNLATGQPLVAGQSLEMVFELHEDDNGAADLVLIVEPQ